jgi:phage shock protein PspC (stress-responsive transcriptional regulator)
MKKTIQIHLGGVTFNVEEDAFAKLSAYLEAIKKYFSSYEGSSEIVEDIENRIAEKLFDKSKAGQVVNTTDVDAIVNSMGTVADFEAFKDEEDFVKTNNPKQEKTAFTENPNESSNTKSNPSSKLFRDGRRKALGGVLSGLAHQVNIDVVWLRILFIILTVSMLEIGVGAFFILAYFVLWAIMPERIDLEEDKSIRKLYRDSENKALGGVASGLASYLNTDVVVIRILFVAGLFLFGSSFLIYILFWIVVPKATSLTQKMELKGQALTIENIESSIKTQANSIPQVESPFTKIVLAPFRILGSILGIFGVFIKPIGSLVKIVAGIFLLMFGVILGISALLSLGMFFGLITDSAYIHGSDLLGLFRKDLPDLAGLFGFLLIFIPSAAMAIIGLSFITGTKYGEKNFWLTMLAIWFAGLVGSAAVGSRYALNFKNQETYVEEGAINTPRGILYLDELPDDENEDNSQNDDFVVNASVNFNTSNSNVLKLEKRFTASGISNKKAMENAKNMSYEFAQKDSMLLFNDQATLSGEKYIRNQDLTLHLYLPKGQKFKVSERFADNIMAKSWEIARKYGIDTEDLDKFTFVMGDNDKIECLDCPQLTEEEREKADDDDDSEILSDGVFDVEEIQKNPKNFSVSNFDKIDIGQAFNIIIEQGAVQSFTAFGSKDDLNDLSVNVNARILKVEYKDLFKKHKGKITLKITMPTISNIDLGGASKSKVVGFKNLKNLKVELSGASTLALGVETEKLEVIISGASKAQLKGTINDLDADLSGASYVDSRSITLNNAKIESRGASRAILGKVKNNFVTNKSGASEVIKE